MAAALVVLLLATLTGTVWSQDPNELVFCYTDRNCNTLTAEPQLTRRQCCVETSEAVGFMVEGDETCNICIVYGFLVPTFSAPERGEPYSLNVGYLKGREEGANLQLRADTEFGSASPVDFTPPTATIRIFPILDEPETTQFTFRVDALAQEPDETLTLVLVNLIDPNFGSNAFFLDRTELVIQDSDCADIMFAYEDFRRSEDEPSIPVVVDKNNRIATPIVVEVSPVTLTEHRATGRDDPPGVIPDNPFSPIEANLADFDNTVIILTFQADEIGDQANHLVVPVPIVDDGIDEANEQVFVISLRILSVTNPKGINFARRDALCTIIDDDDVRIGFERPFSEFTEPEQFQEDIVNEVFLAKENGVLSEQTFQLVISVSETVPNNTFQPATHAAGGEDNDYQIGPTPVQLLIFPPQLQRIPFDITLFPDDIAEGPEAFQAIPSQDSTPTFLQPLILSEKTFILIEDNDRLFIGFETNYTVNETVGTVEVCAVVTFPPNYVPITSRNIVFLSVNTIEGTAESDSDYLRILASEGRVALIFDNTRRTSCFPLTIVHDEAFENTESLTIDLAFLGPPPNSIVLDPDVTTVTILDDEVSVSLTPSGDAPTQGGGSPAVGQSYSLSCTVTVADQHNPTITYRWFKDNNTVISGETQSTLSFSSLCLSDAGQYRCDATVSSALLNRNITINSGGHKLIIPTVLFQIRLNGMPNCHDWVLRDPFDKLYELKSALVQAVKQACKCGFTSSHITEDAFQCFPESQQHVTFRARLTETSQATTPQLITHVEQWASTTRTIPLRGYRLGINNTCDLVINEFHDEECPMKDKLGPPTSSAHEMATEMFQIKFGPTDHCINWNAARAKEIQPSIHKPLLEAVKFKCRECDLPRENLLDGVFTCQSSHNQTTYRSTIIGTQSHNATELVGLIQDWVTSAPTITIQWYTVRVDPKCPVSISSLGDPECGETTEDCPHRDDPNISRCVDVCIKIASSQFN